MNEDVPNYYRANFEMIHEFGYDLQTLENMIPYEREIYMLLLIKRLKEKAEEAKKHNAGG